jgi:hypothetical protein
LEKRNEGIITRYVKRLLGAGRGDKPRVQADRFEIVKPVAKPTDQLGNKLSIHGREWLMPSDFFDVRVFELYKFLRDNIPDISGGIWAWVALSSTRQTVEYIGGTEKERERASAIVMDLAQRIYPYEHTKNLGMDGVTEHFFRSTYTYGAFASELVLSRRRREVISLNFINPATIRFKRQKNTWKLNAYQTEPGNKPATFGSPKDKDLIKLNPNTFYYYGLGADNDNPYGTSMISCIPFVAQIQTRMINDMEKTMHNAGYPRYHVKFTPPAQNVSESNDDYISRIGRQYDQVNNQFKMVPPDANFISYDNVQIIVLDAAGKISIEWYNNHKAVTEQVITGLKLAPFLLGKNYGTADQWATSQYDLILRNARMVQNAAKRMLEWIYNLELMLKGSKVRAEVHFDQNRSAGDQLQNQADDMKMTTIIKKRDEGIITQDQAAKELGYDSPALPGPDEKIMYLKSKAFTKKVDVDMKHSTEDNEDDEKDGK